MNEDLVWIITAALLGAYPITRLVLRFLPGGLINVSSVFQATKEGGSLSRLAYVYSREHKQEVLQLGNRKLKVVYIQKKEHDYEELNIKVRGMSGVLIVVFKKGELDQLGVYPNIEVQPEVDRQTSMQLFLLLSEVRKVADK